MNRQQDLFDTGPQPWELDDRESCLVATVVFSTGPEKPFDYKVGEKLLQEVVPGRRVRVPFGRSNRLVQGYCVAVESREINPAKLKEIKEVVDQQTLVSSSMLDLTRWMADYYLSPWGQVLDSVVPAAVRGNAGTREVTLLSVRSEVAAQIANIKLPPKQKALLTHLAASPKPMTPPELANVVGCTQAPITSLRKKGLLQSEIRRVSHAHFDDTTAEREPAKKLNEDQAQALSGILSVVEAEQHETILLHGVTGSGKTEVYIQAIEKVVEQGKQAIVLVPEISLTPQTKQRFRARFNQIAMLHSHMTDVERHWQWKRIASGLIDVVVGARSAIFAPTPRLGMIVIDEEHDGSFKQDSSPRYHARDVAASRAQREKIPLILGTATPALESWYQTQQGNYRLIEMPRRVNNLPLPQVKIIDLRIDSKKQGRGAISRQLYFAMKRTLEDDGQIILLLNRRGYATHIQCPACGHLVACPHCEMALTHHLTDNKTVCHYCDYATPAPNTCPECNFSGIRYSGYGTQKLEAEVRGRFSGYECLRMDSDTMSKRGSHEVALDRFREGKSRILVGTQMIAKGLDFPNVTLVGVINADTALHFPDVRAGERTFQLITQVAGRTGRGEKGGLVLVQTLSPDHAAIQAASRHDYGLFASNELPFRESFGFSPYVKMIRIVARGPSEAKVSAFLEQASQTFLSLGKKAQTEFEMLGPAPAPIEKLRGNYRFHLLLKSEAGAELKELVRQFMAQNPASDDVQWIVDIDPLDML
ncbi:MAG: primosomal protein N' [Blastopirellula sp.]|nr:MAG: primosomal protein N' [Blastopirellula sp.]